MKMIEGETRKEEKEKEEEEEEEEEHILRFKSDIPLPPIPNTNYAAFLLNIMAQHGGKKALMDASTGKHHTYSDICAMVPRVCAGLMRAGVRAGDAVLLISPNHIDFMIANLAILLLPAVCALVNPALSAEEVVHLAGVSGAQWAVVEEGVEGMVEKLVSLLPPNTLKGVWVIGTSPRHPSFASLMREEAQISAANNNSATFDASSTVALMMFSSGTTGLPKGVMLSHRNLLTCLSQTIYLTDTGGEEARERAKKVYSRVLLALPQYHNFGYFIAQNTTTRGGCVVLMGRFSLRSFLHAIQKYKVTYTPLVPHIAAYLAQSPLVKEYDLTSLLVVSSGSAPIAPTTQQDIMKKFVRFMGNGYGLTEACAPLVVSHPRQGFRPGSVGKLMPYVELKIVALGTSKALGVGEEGELWVRSPGVMLGYAPAPGDSPSSSPKGLKPGGWLPTGDLGKVDEDGFVFLTDRIKDLIKVKGYQVAPSELETVLREVEGVGEVAVVGVPSPRLGEAPRAYVVPSPGVPAPSPQALEEHVAARVVPYKRLAGGVELVEALPKNALGKVMKRKLRDEYVKKTVAAAADDDDAVPNSKL